MIRSIRQRLEDVPYAFLALPLRLAAVSVFWRSGMSKLANWETTLYLFEEEYRVPVLPPELAAYLATSVELAAPVLLVDGFLARPAAAALLAMTAVIQIFVYPMAWSIHIQWAAMLLVLLCRGAGRWSVDHFIWGRAAERSPATT